MAAAAVALGHDVEEERLDVVVEGLVIQKQFSQKAKILAVNLVLLAVYFEYRDIGVPIDLIAGRMTKVTFHL